MRESADCILYGDGDEMASDQDMITSALGRFVKLGGEMVSLPAIESVLDAAFRGDYVLHSRPCPLCLSHESPF